jgi:hypothetical protein
MEIEMRPCNGRLGFFLVFGFWFFIDKLLTLQYRAGSDCVGGVSNLDLLGEP